MYTHDPNRQISYLQQCLSGNKKPLGFLVGAGCPMSIQYQGNPIIPDIKGITSAIKQSFDEDADLKGVLNKITAQLEADGSSDPNIELILSHIRSLIVVVGNDTVRGLAADELKKIDKAICEEIERIVEKNHIDENSPYHHFANWSNSIDREHPITVFTTNYDLLLEEALESTKTPFFDGFSGSKNAFFDLQAVEEDAIPKRWVRLWKLHGSINWFRAENGNVFRSSVSPADTDSRLIHPSHLKYDESRRMPFLVMIDRLRAFLKQPTSLLVLNGYSFGDEHLNEVIMQGLQANPSSMAFALLYGELKNYETAIRLASTRSNLTLIAFDSGVVGGIKASWSMSEMMGELPLSDKWLVNVPKEAEPEEIDHTELRLGDFAVLGEFLRVLSGINEPDSNNSDE
ncbi:SIR2 family protein [Puniceicoccus vermicola]|uniref:SIR2 family protein n=1 Tax=Puniceicoccus vermicola TaxID=388746 RepID=A0A7X1AWD8_9BACT|nr:SIR2 family protein [Puniceicoccus vermicola]MBC2601014.1 SIR2 family protein [Puniceicoccus vermicola]